MRDITRQSIFRIVYDMMKADELISTSEIEFIKSICEKYEITPEFRELAMSMSLADAVGEIKTMPVRQLATFIDELAQLSLSDGSCCRAEALLLLACHECLTGDKAGTLVSIPCSDVMLSNNQILFVENGYDEEINEIVKRNYSAIANSLRVGDLDFVYLPKLLEHFTTSKALLDDVIYYLTPSNTIEQAMAIAESMRAMTSESLFRELILGKLGFDLDISGPSLVLRVGVSMSGEMMAHYLIVPLVGDILQQISELVERFLKYQNSSFYLVRNNTTTEDCFVYSGFYRTLFDLMTYRQGAQSKLVVHPYNHKNVLSIVTRDADSEVEHPLDIGPKESAFYVFLIKETINYGGFNIAANDAESVKYLENAQRRYEDTYLSLCNREVAPDITDSDIRRPMLSKIKKAIEQHSSLVQKMTFIPETTKDKVIKVHLKDICNE